MYGVDGVTRMMANFWAGFWPKKKFFWSNFGPVLPSPGPPSLPFNRLFDPQTQPDPVSKKFDRFCSNFPIFFQLFVIFWPLSDQFYLLNRLNLTPKPI